MKKNYLISLLALIISSCNNQLNDAVVKSNNVQSYNYTLIENGCSTGEQQYSSLNDMCIGLKNDSRNNYCAYNLRKSKYELECFSYGPW